MEPRRSTRLFYHWKQNSRRRVGGEVGWVRCAISHLLTRASRWLPSGWI